MTPNTGQRKGLLASARGTKEPKRPPKYRRGGVVNTGASLQPPRPDQNAGRASTENAKFLGQMKELVYGKGMLQEQLQEAEKERGIAEFEKANAEQREGFRDAINNGWIDSKESPYFREAVTVSHTKNLLTKTSLDLYTEYEKWEGKNDPSSGAFDRWLETQDEKIAINLENIPDSILANNFYEPHQAIKRQLAQQHAGYLNKEYRDKANAEVDLRFNGLMKQYSQAMGLDLGSDPNMTVAQILKKQGITQEQAWRIGGLLKTVPKSGDNVGIMPKESLRQLELMAKNEGGIAADTLYNYNGTDVETLRLADEYEIAWENTLQGQAIASASRNITPEADANTIPEFHRSYSEQNLVKDYEQVLQQQAEDFKNVLAVTATIPEGEMRDEGISRTFENTYAELDYDEMMSQEYDKRLPKNPKFRSLGATETEFVGDYTGGGRKGTDDKYAPKWLTGRSRFKGTSISPQYLAKATTTDLSENELDRLTRLSTSMKKELKSDTTAIAKTMKVVTDTAVKNIPLKRGAGGNSETMLSIVIEDGMKGGVYKDWFVQLNESMPKDTLLAISHAFFDEHHEGLLKKRPKEGFESTIKTRRVGSKFATTEVNETTFVSFVKNHPLFDPYKKSTGS